MLTQARLKELLHYDPETGLWIRRVAQSNCAAGSEAGYLKREQKTESWRRYIGVDWKYYIASRLAFLYMTGRWPTRLIDHIDLNTLNDRWDNIREADDFQNQANKATQRNNKSGYRGVYFRKRDGSIMACIRRHKRHRHLGTFDTVEDAHAAYMAAAAAIDGEFTRAA